MRSEWLQFVFFIGIFICATPILGIYIANIFTGKATLAYRTLGWLESLCYRISGADPSEEMTWYEYGKALFLFNFFGFIMLFFLQLLQNYLPLNPQNFSGVSWHLSYNTAISFTTNTNWQSYAGETTLSYLTQMLGLASQNFLSSATGMGALLALIRGLTRKKTNNIGNFWVDIVRMIVYLLLPLSITLSIFLVEEGVIQNFSPYAEVTTLENAKQTIPLGPVASQVAIKQLGTNGGGFFNVNSAHPFENPTPVSNFLEMLAIIVIPAATVYAYGMMIGSKKHAWLIYSVMLFFWFCGIFVSATSEHLHNPIIDAYPNLEGKETRFGLINSLLWSVTTTTTSNGSINAMLSSMSPLAGGSVMFNMMLGELAFGGLGCGLCSMIMFILLTVFLSGLMVGRTPEYLGKKIERKEIQWVVIAVLAPVTLILVGAGISVVLPDALSSLGNQGPHGLSEILYAFTSSAANNGSAFAGLNTNTVYYNVALGTVMLLARVAIILPSLALAGLLAHKKVTPPSSGTFSTSSFLFFLLLIGVIFIVGALAFFPALALGPIVEHLLMLEGQSF
jgi:K+-transporting ATPase ATPase A chain